MMRNGVNWQGLTIDLYERTLPVKFVSRFVVEKVHQGTLEITHTKHGLIRRHFIPNPDSLPRNEVRYYTRNKVKCVSIPYYILEIVKNV